MMRSKFKRIKKTRRKKLMLLLNSWQSPWFRYRKFKKSSI